MNVNEIKTVSWYQEATKSGGFVIEAEHILQGYPGEYYLNDLTFVFSINRKIELHGGIFGVLSVNYKPDAVLGMFKKNETDTEIDLYLCNKTGEIICGTNPEITEKELSHSFLNLSTGKNFPACRKFPNISM